MERTYSIIPKGYTFLAVAWYCIWDKHFSYVHYWYRVPDCFPVFLLASLPNSRNVKSTFLFGFSIHCQWQNFAPNITKATFVCLFIEHYSSVYFRFFCFCWHRRLSENRVLLTKFRLYYCDIHSVNYWEVTLNWWSSRLIWNLQSKIKRKFAGFWQAQGGPTPRAPDKCGHSPTLSGFWPQRRIRRLVVLSAKSRPCR